MDGRGGIVAALRAGAVSRSRLAHDRSLNRIAIVLEAEHGRIPSPYDLRQHEAQIDVGVRDRFGRELVPSQAVVAFDQQCRIPDAASPMACAVAVALFPATG